MHIVIMGCGRVGSSLARSLEKRGHSVAVIDVDAESFLRLGPTFRGITVRGVGFDKDVLIAAGIEHADGFAAVSSGDNSNVLAARTVREEFGVHNVMARIYDQGRAAVYERLGIPTVATVRWAANQLLRGLLPEGAEPIWRDPSGKISLVQIGTHPSWIGSTIGEMQHLVNTPLPFLIRYGEGLVPTDRTVLQEGDLLFAAIASNRIDELEQILGEPAPRL